MVKIPRGKEADFLSKRDLGTWALFAPRLPKSTLVGDAAGERGFAVMVVDIASAD